MSRLVERYLRDPNALYAESGASRCFVLVELGGDAVEDGLMASGYSVPDGAAFAPDVRLEHILRPDRIAEDGHTEYPVVD